MESLANFVEDKLIDSLSFKLPSNASYVSNRRGCTFWPSGSNVYTTGSGTKLLKFNLVSEDWLDTSTVRVFFTLNNKEGDANKRLRPLTGPYGFFRRLRILCGGAVLEDFMDYNRTHHMFSALVADMVRDNEDIEGFGYSWDDRRPGVAVETYTDATLPGIAGNSSQVVSCILLSGIFNQEKMIPLRFAPLVIELELVSDATECIISPPVGVFDTSNTSTNWEINQCMINCDICTLDNALHNQYVSHLLEGKALPIKYDTFITQQQSVKGNQDISVNVSRAASLLKSVFITFFQSNQPATLVDGTNNPLFNKKLVNKQALEFSHPMAWLPSGYYDKNYELQWQIQLGSKLFPEYPVQSLSETFYQLRKTLSLPEYHQHSVSVDFNQYKKDKFIIAMNMEKVPEASFTGENTKAGQLLYIRVKPANSTSVLTSDKMFDSMFITLHAECTVEIRDVGCTVFD
jgi:hypothetical protein